MSETEDLELCDRSVTSAKSTSAASVIVPTLNSGHDAESAASALPPVDGGWRAWSFLVAATVIVMLIWGLPYSIGVLHVYWTDTLIKGEGGSTLTLAATLQNGLLYMATALSGPLFTAFPRWQRALQYCGLLAAVITFISSAFATKPWHILVTFGLIYPLSGICYLPCNTLLFEYFFSLRGIATGIVFGGTGLGGASIPFLMNGLLNKIGYKATMISFGLGYLVIGSIAIVFVRPRIPVSRQQTMEKRKPVNWSFMKSTPLIIGTITIFLISLGNFIPSLWLPAYASSLKLTHPSGTGLIAILNAASVPGNTLLGYLSDHMPVRKVIVISCVGSGLSCAFLWGFGSTDGVLILFALIFGLLGPSFSAIWTQMIGLICKDDLISPPLVVSLFTFVRGVGSLTSGPISQALLKINNLNGSIGAYGFSNYGVLLIYASVTILSGGATGYLFKSS
ncbi:monocarboxylic acid transporter [Cryptococcus neoformans Tu401-1]|nr:monocarboxylic acid transporter [Cryptococcus neoformans var. grubii Bt85]OXG16130.1 monocarboxylic acid transporter [Cryptococcus neoformans var. grubii Tu401-1]OXM78385.1 monocarboxylic acid transporter [Cryptococcus neoformans var. grubii Bt63]